MSQQIVSEWGTGAFQRDLLDSIDSVWTVARFLSDSGYDVEVPVTKVIANGQRREDFTDNGDLFIKKPIEVKRRVNMNFRSLEEYPFDTVFVDTLHHWTEMKNKPLGYFILNKEATGAITIHGSTRDSWIVETKFQAARGRERTMLLCPKNLCKYIDLRKKKQ